MAGIHRRTIQKKKKSLRDPENHNDMITHLEPNILECEVKWALGSITMNRASKGDRIPAELFQILKDDAVKRLHSVCQQIWKTTVSTRLEKASFNSIPKERHYQRNYNCHTTAFIAHANKVMLKCLQVTLQQYLNREHPDE